MPAATDILLFQWLHAGAGSRPLLDRTAVFLAEAGPWLLAAVFMATWWRGDSRCRITLIGAAVAAALGLLVNQLIGWWYFHPRPFMINLCTPLFPHDPETSFPSDHATLLVAATVYATAAAGRRPGLLPPLVAITLLTMWARVYCGIHFPFDMLGSLAVGTGSALFLHRWRAALEPASRGLVAAYDQATEILRKTMARHP